VSMPYPLVPLGEVLRLSIDAVPVESTTSYPIAGVYSFGRGLFAREPLKGSETTYKVFHRLHSNDFVLSKLKGWEGALAKVPGSFDGWFLSPQFPTFRADPNHLDISYLSWYCKQSMVWENLKNKARGMGARRDSVSPATFLALEIPLPSLSEQRRIVARIEELAAKIEEARELRQQVLKETDRLLIAMAHRRDLSGEAKLQAGWDNITLGDIITRVQDTESVDPSKSYPNFGIYSFGRGLFSKSPIDGISTSARTLYRVRKGQFIYSRLFAFEGAYGTVSEQFNGHYVSNEYPTFELDQNRVNLAFLSAYFKSPLVWSEIATGSQGLGHRRQRVHPDKILGHRLMLPPIDWQQKIANVHTEVEVLRRLQTESSSELEALLPSILDKIFKGDL
jgi:type I restriction enzyme S subunit